MPLLLLHLLETDSIQHQYAPLTPAAYAAYAYADSRLAQVVEAVRSIGAIDRTTFIVTSDHGFATYTHTISPNAALVQQGLLHKEGDRYIGTLWAKAEGGGAQIFIRDKNARAALIPKLKLYFESVPGVERVYTNEAADAIGFPTEGITDQAPQLYIVAKAGYAFTDDTEGDLSRENLPRGQHGYLNTDPDMQAIFVASGARIRAGVHLGPISNLRVAPTIAEILGVSLPEAKQPPLTEILK